MNGRWDLRGLTAPPVRHDPTGERGIERLSGCLEVRGATWADLDLSGARLESLRVFDSHFSNCVFDKATLADSRIWGTRVERCSFEGADLRGVMLGGGDQPNAFADSSFDKSDMRQTVHGSAAMARCSFRNTKLTKVDFQGTVFTSCLFEGHLDEVIFYRHAFEGERFPPNEMENVDLRDARFHFTEFRRLDLKTVQWPTAADHVLVADYVASLDRALHVLANEPGDGAKRIGAILELDRKWAGPRQDVGMVCLPDLIECGGETLAARVVDVLLNRGVVGA